jgi:mRNA interferase RelE/StbE
VRQAYLRVRSADSADLRQFGKPLRMNLARLRQYGVRNYRLICRFDEQRLVVLLFKVGQRREV